MLQTVYLYGRGGSQAAFDGLVADAVRTGTAYSSGGQASGFWAAVRGSAGHLDTSLDMLRRLTIDARLDLEEYARRQEEWVQVARRGGSSVALAERLVLFGNNHPYGFAGFGPAIIALPAAHEIHGRLFQSPANASLLVVGDVTQDRLEPSAERAFGGWPISVSTPVSKQSAPPPRRFAPRVSVVSNRGLTQMRAAVFARGPAPSSDDILAFTVAANCLGGARSSKLLEQLREDTGAAYDVGAWTYLERTASWMSLAASYDADKAVGGLGAVLAAVRELRAGEVTEEQVAVARETFLAAWREAMSTVEGAATAYALWIGLGMDPDRPREIPARVANLRRDDLVGVANQYLTDSALHVVFEGDDRWLDASPLGMGGVATLDWPK